MDPVPVEVTWGPEGIEVIWAVEKEWVSTRASVRDYLRSTSR